jgi:hypothetical protein
MGDEVISVLKPELVSRGLSVCRVKSGEIVVSAHQGEQHILLTLSQEEFDDFSERLSKLCVQRKPRLFVQEGEFLCKWPRLRRIWALLCKADGAQISALFGISCVYLL